MVGESASVVRATIMGILLLWADHLGRSYAAPNALFASGMVMTFFDPNTLFDVGFQLSFMATLGLMVYAPHGRTGVYMLQDGLRLLAPEDLAPPARVEIAADRLREAKLRAAEETLRMALQARRSYYRAVAALQIVASLENAGSAGETTAKLAKELVQTGAMNKLDQAREEAFQADLLIRLATARRAAASERERLIRALGLSGADLRFRLPRALPALVEAQQIASKAAGVGFDWENAEQVLEKLHEELAEFAQARRNAAQDELEDELGDMLFVLVNLARFVKVDPEQALRRTNAKFRTRWNP